MPELKLDGYRGRWRRPANIGDWPASSPLFFVRKTPSRRYRELVECVDSSGSPRLGMVMDSSDDLVVAQIFEGTQNLTMPDTTVRFTGKPLSLGVSTAMLGRVFDGLGRPIDSGPPPKAEREVDVNGRPINPTAREYPRDFIQTGISAIDGMNTLIRGQKLPIFSGNGLPHNELAAQIARQAKIRGGKTDFAVVFAAMGVKHDVARFFIRSFEETGSSDNVALFLSLADDPSIERIVSQGRPQLGGVFGYEKECMSWSFSPTWPTTASPCGRFRPFAGRSPPERDIRATCTPTSPKSTSARA